ncbi:MAG: hypothetical protein GF383_08040 [Candidatus Lokiarchaeota archaeon]|nr:hypothetical protein [Candidatus Lokiarchaeota archaeon]MBD3340282.1 hypothetical protein [Candidatus Lokiarchaeota archaeon]
MEGNWKDEIPTPALVLNYNIMEDNLRYMADFVKETKVNLRQHIKTAKVPFVAHLQQRMAGEYAKGIAVATVGEAEVYAQCGFDDILIANQVVEISQIRRLMNLTKYLLVRVCVDSKKNILDLNRFAEKYNTKLELLIDVDLGFGRTGVKPGEPTLKMAEIVRELPNLDVVGLQGYEGHLTPQTDYELRKEQTKACMSDLIATRDLMNENGFNIDYLSTSGSGTFMFASKIPGITEIQPGTYVFSDEHVERVVPEFKPAATVLATVQSNTAKRSFTLDAGLKAVPTGDGRPIIKNYPKSRFRVFSEEHSQFKCGLKETLELGQKVELIPAHICITVNLYDFIHVVKDGEYIGRWPILARGKNY